MKVPENKMKMLSRRRTTYILLLVNLAMILFVVIRSGSVKIEQKARVSQSITIRVLEQPPTAIPDTLILNDFEKDNDLMNMYDQGGEYSLDLSPEHATHNSTSLMVIKDPDSNIELATIHFPKEWDRYDALELDVFNDSHKDGTLWLRIGNQYDARRFYVSSQKYARSLVLSPGANTIAIPVDDIAKAFGRLPKRKSIHFNFPAGGGHRYYIDFLRMVRHDSADE